MRFLLAGILCIKGSVAFAQLLHPPMQLPYAASVGLSRHQADAFSFHTNPATLWHLHKPHAGLSGVQSHMLPGVRSGALSVAVPAGNTYFGAVVQHYGAASFYHTAIQFSSAQSLGKKAAVGASFHYRSVAAAGYGAIGMWGAGIGGLYQVSEQLQAGAYLFVPAAVTTKKPVERLAGYYHVGLGWDLSPQVFVSTSFMQTESFKPDVHASISYKPVPAISARLGLQSANRELIVGAGFLHKKMQLHLFTGLHPRLGFSPGLQLLLGQNDVAL
ncbi:hypothetical protein [Pseudocnuella soli]|uniref:hypothetical protein n=1 Tax=Pseudocnuella soli TaxID=2502779 RepID=UPI00104989ED|nr:hypothetical protein [Pseudocnuella soli]